MNYLTRSVRLWCFQFPSCLFFDCFLFIIRKLVRKTESDDRMAGIEFDWLSKLCRYGDLAIPELLELHRGFRPAKFGQIFTASEDHVKYEGKTVAWPRLARSYSKRPRWPDEGLIV